MTNEQIQAGFKTLVAVAEAIRELKSVPSGHLYARLMGVLSLEQYNKIIDILKRQGLVVEKFHELTWVGPAAK